MFFVEQNLVKQHNAMFEMFAGYVNLLDLEAV
jgi:hypothetical protein